MVAANLLGRIEEKTRDRQNEAEELALADHRE